MELDNTSILHRLLEDEEIRHQLDGYLQMQHVYSAAIQEVQEGDELVYSFVCTWDF